MEIKKIFLYQACLFIVCVATLLSGGPVLALKPNTHPDNLIDFNFDNIDLTEIIGMLAAKEEKNIIFPQDALAIKQKVNIHLPNKVTLAQAWEYVSQFLNLAGYTMFPHNGVNMIVKSDASNRDTLPIYVGFNPQDFPHTDNKIRAIVYLSNLKVPDKFDPADKVSPISQILQDVLSANKSVNYDPKSNAIIVADSANKLATALNIIMLLDRSGDPNVVEVVKLYNVDASVVADLLKNQILALTGDAKGGAAGALKADVKSETGLYFGSGSVNLVADNRLNSIILTGAASSIERIKDLIGELDQPTDSGKSILHVYELQYLDADTFAPVLAKLVEDGAKTGQATKDLQGGARRVFEGVIITAEKKVKESYRKYSESTEGKQGELKSETFERSGNRLVVTAREQDWLRIRDLIQSLDIPQPIVIVEVMVIDVTKDENKILGTQLRNLTANVPTTNASNGVTAQSSLLYSPGSGSPSQGVILNTSGSGTSLTNVPEPAKLAADLLSLVFPGSPATSIADSLTSGVGSGSLIMSFNDPNGTGVWGVLQVLDSVTDLKILSHPFLVAKNNKEAEAIISTIKRDVGQAFAGQAAVVSQKYEDIEARLRVGIIPRVSSLDRINMQIAVDVQEFLTVSASNFTRNTRTVNTNANISSGQVLALGGLGTFIEIESTRKVPILSDIPIIGSLFSYNARSLERVNLLILIAPTIIEPKIRGGIEVYTRNKISTGFEVFETESVLGSPRDPVTRWFFKDQLAEGRERTDVFLSEAKGDFVHEFESGVNKKRDNTKPRRNNRKSRNKKLVAPTQPQQRASDTRQYVTESKFGI